MNKYGVLLSVWATLTYGQRNYYYNKLSKKNCAKATWARVPAEKRAQINAKSRERRQNNPEERRKKDREYFHRNIEKRRESARRYYYSHHSKMIEKHKRRWARERSKRQISLSPDAVFKLIDSAISRSLPKFVRDDIISAMCLAVLDGQLFVENITKEAKKFVSAYNREYDHFKTISLDAPLAGHDGLTLLDKLADPQLGRQ
ncbi:hypothetical protein [Rhizobium sp. BK418]|uniref:hypothetical protein n=1 Tax=Rhizobium sp. BK418 TaxID=2512120 RepID=UPI0010529BA1|nr:hypothetical protein [Rhizobium sp. BK418]